MSYTLSQLLKPSVLLANQQFQELVEANEHVKADQECDVFLDGKPSKYIPPKIDLIAYTSRKKVPHLEALLPGADVAGSGTYGSVIKSLGSIECNKDQKIKISDTPHAIKTVASTASTLEREVKILNLTRVGKGVCKKAGGDKAYIIMRNLGFDWDQIRAKLVLTPEKRMFMFAGAFNYLANLHQLKLLHRDIKPNNMFYNPAFVTEKVMFGDYGLSTEVGDTKATLCGHSFGIPPEIVFSQSSYTFASEVFASMTWCLDYFSNSSIRCLPKSFGMDVKVMHHFANFLYNQQSAEYVLAQKFCQDKSFGEYCEQSNTHNQSFPENFIRYFCKYFLNGLDLSDDIVNSIITALNPDPTQRPSAESIAKIFNRYALKLFFQKNYAYIEARGHSLQDKIEDEYVLPLLNILHNLDDVPSNDKSFFRKMICTLTTQEILLPCLPHLTLISETIEHLVKGLQPQEYAKIIELLFNIFGNLPDFTETICLNLRQWRKNLQPDKILPSSILRIALNSLASSAASIKSDIEDDDIHQLFNICKCLQTNGYFKLHKVEELLEILTDPMIVADLESLRKFIFEQERNLTKDKVIENFTKYLDIINSCIKFSADKSWKSKFNVLDFLKVYRELEKAKYFNINLLEILTDPSILLFLKYLYRHIRFVTTLQGGVMLAKIFPLYLEVIKKCISLSEENADLWLLSASIEDYTRYCHDNGFEKLKGLLTTFLKIDLSFFEKQPILVLKDFCNNNIAKHLELIREIMTYYNLEELRGNWLVKDKGMEAGSSFGKIIYNIVDVFENLQDSLLMQIEHKLGEYKSEVSSQALSAKIGLMNTLHDKISSALTIGNILSAINEAKANPAAGVHTGFGVVPGFFGIQIKVNTKTLLLDMEQQVKGCFDKAEDVVSSVCKIDGSA